MSHAPSFVLTPPTEKRPHKIVRQTSRAVYAYGRQTFVGQKAIVLKGIAAWWNSKNRSATAGELAFWLLKRGELSGHCLGCASLLVRRRLWDLKQDGIVEPVPNGNRLCNVTERDVECWRVREIGSDEPR